MAFCREAPPEFNEHQRDVFCVFSGTGVARLRGFLNEQKAHQAAVESASSSLVIADDGELIDVDIDDRNPDSDESNGSVVNVNVYHNYPHGQTPIVPGPTGPLPSNGFPPLPPGFPGAGINAGVPLNFSQSAPATTGVANWANGHPTVVVQQGGSAQHITGIMGATILDEVDGDEAFGEGSEMMGD